MTQQHQKHHVIPQTAQAPLQGHQSLNQAAPAIPTTPPQIVVPAAAAQLNMKENLRKFAPKIIITENRPTPDPKNVIQNPAATATATASAAAIQLAKKDKQE